MTGTLKMGKVYFPKMKKIENPNRQPIDRESVKELYKKTKKTAKENGIKPPTMGSLERMLKEDNEMPIYSNGIYEVHVHDENKDNKFEKPVHLSIKNYERTTDVPWQHKQWIKNDIMGEEFEAVELFPAESRVVNTANQYHLWCFPKGIMMFGWPTRVVTKTKPEGKGQQDLTVRVYNKEDM